MILQINIDYCINPLKDMGYAIIGLIILMSDV